MTTKASRANFAHPADSNRPNQYEPKSHVYRLRNRRGFRSLSGPSILLIAFIAGVFGPSLAAAQPGNADAQQIIERSVEAIKRDFAAAPQFECTERDQNATGSRTYRNLMIDGSGYQKLTAVDDKPLSPEDQAQEEQKLRDEVARRQNESAAERAQRISKFQTDQQRNHELILELTKAFNFQLLGTDHLDGYQVFVLQATPRPGYQPINRDTEVLTGMKGKLWIDQESFQWVKVQAKVIHPVAIEGILARVEPGTRFELEKMPVAPGIWLPRHFSMKSQSKIFFLFPHHDSEEEFYSDYRRVSPPAAPANVRP